MSHEPIAYTYEADYHCPTCAEQRFGRDAEGFIGVHDLDNEGNPVGVVAPWDEWQNYEGDCEHLACGDCLEIIDTTHAELCTCS